MEVKDYIDFKEVWNGIKVLNIGCLEDYQTKLVNCSLEQAEEFIKQDKVAINTEECYVDGNDINLSFGENWNVSEGDMEFFNTNVVVDMACDGAISSIEFG